MLQYLNMIDQTVLRIDRILRKYSKSPKQNIIRSNPASNLENTEPLSAQERQQSIVMMRINHSGEVCAQALYQGQAIMAKSPTQHNSLLEAAAEEAEHLTWCKQRLTELNGNTSLFNPLWYAGSLGIGALAGLTGDQLSLGFLAETEQQVSQHLEKHLRQMSTKDLKSRAILEQMRVDELQHAAKAEQAGAKSLPISIKVMMKLTAKIMTITAAKF